MAGTGTGTAAEPTEQQKNTVIVIRDFVPGQVVTIVFLTTAEAKALPAIPPNALQIAVAPAGGI